MDHQDIRTLRILEEIEGNHAPSQRYLSNQLNISLGLVNSFLKRLAQKGYFKATAIPKNRVKYLLTPKGALEKSRLTYAYVQHSFQYYRDARKKLRETLSQLNQSGVTNIVFYGAGELAEIAYLFLQETNIKLLAIVDEEKQAKSFFNFQIQPLEVLRDLDFDKVFITKIDASGGSLNRFLEYGIQQKDIISFQ